MGIELARFRRLSAVDLGARRCRVVRRNLALRVRQRNHVIVDHAPACRRRRRRSTSAPARRARLPRSPTRGRGRAQPVPARPPRAARCGVRNVQAPRHSTWPHHRPDRRGGRPSSDAAAHRVAAPFQAEPARGAILMKIAASSPACWCCATGNSFGRGRENGREKTRRRRKAGNGRSRIPRSTPSVCRRRARWRRRDGASSMIWNRRAARSAQCAGAEVLRRPAWAAAGRRGRVKSTSRHFACTKARCRRCSTTKRRCAIASSSIRRSRPTPSSCRDCRA